MSSVYAASARTIETPGKRKKCFWLILRGCRSNGFEPIGLEVKGLPRARRVEGYTLYPLGTYPIPPLLKISRSLGSCKYSAGHSLGQLFVLPWKIIYFRRGKRVKGFMRFERKISSFLGEPNQNSRSAGRIIVFLKK